VKAFLERDRHAVQRPPVLAARQRRIRLDRTRPRPLEISDDDGVESRVQLRNAGKIGVDNLDTRDLAGCDLLCRLPRRHGKNVKTHIILPCRQKPYATPPPRKVDTRRNAPQFSLRRILEAYLISLARLPYMLSP